MIVELSVKLIYYQIDGITIIFKVCGGKYETKVRSIENKRNFYAFAFSDRLQLGTKKKKKKNTVG